MWEDNPKAKEDERRLCKLLRIMSYKFLANESIPYIYAEKCQIENIIKYRQALLFMLKDP